MEFMTQMAVGKSEFAEGRADASANGHMLASDSFKESDYMGNESAFYEKFLLDDLESYWDDLEARLTVSRMVSDSVIKGMVNAVAEEAAEKISSKEAEIALLNKRLLSCSAGIVRKSSGLNVGTERVEVDLVQSYLDASSACNYTRHLGSLKIAVDEKLQKVEESVEAARGTETLAGIDERVDDLRVMLAVSFEQINGMFYSMKASAFEQQWEHDIQREVVAIAIQNSIMGLHNESEAKLREQRRDFNALDMTWQKKMAELTIMREELDAISRSLSSELGSLSSHHSFEIFEEQNSAKGRDHFPRNLFGNHQKSCISDSEEKGMNLVDKSENSPKAMIDLAVSVHLKHMTKEEVIAYYNTEVVKMRRQHDQALLEKTEELFKFKRDFLKEKGSSYFRKDKEFETLRRRIPEVISKLDNVLLEKDSSHMIHDNHDELSSLNNKIDALLVENQHLRGSLRDKRKEITVLASQASDAASEMYLHSSAETKFSKRIRKLKEDLEDVKIEAEIRDELRNSILKETICEHKCGVGDVLIESDIVQEIYSIISGGVVGEATTAINTFISKYYVEKASREIDHAEKEKGFLFEMEENNKLKQEIISLSSLMKEKEKAFLEENNKLKQEIISLSTLMKEKENAFLEENNKLKQEIISLSTLMKEKEKFASDTCSALVQQKEHFDLINKELGILREQLYKKEILILDKNTELDLVKSKLSEAMEQVSQYKISVDVLNQRFKIASNSLDEADEENTMLRDSIEEMQAALSAFATKDKEQVKQMECISNSAEKFSRTVADVENKLVEDIQRNKYRLEKLSRQCTSLTEQVSLVREKEMWYTQILELKSSNLQKAEVEVDLLGDEVDALLSLLGKIYVALDHYSPVFELYPGVMDILKLVQRELKGETIRLV